MSNQTNNARDAELEAVYLEGYRDGARGARMEHKNMVRMTDRDLEIWSRWNAKPGEYGGPVRDAYRTADARDADLMASIEARRENVWRINGVALSVADLCAYAPHERDMLAAGNGEAL